MLRHLISLLGLSVDRNHHKKTPPRSPRPEKEKPKAISAGAEKTRNHKTEGIEKLEGDGLFSFPVVGESHYQANLEAIAGPKEKKGKSLSCVAVIEHEPSNEWDANACAVFIDGYRVGHLAKSDSKDLVSVGGVGCCYSVDAVINGGYETSRYSGKYGVVLDFLPTQFPATPIQKEMFRFFGLKAAKGLTRGDAWDQEAAIKDDEKYLEWNDYRLIIDYLHSEEGREDYCIRKPSMKAIRDAYSKLRADGHSSKDLAGSMDEVVEMMTEENPNLEKD